MADTQTIRLTLPTAAYPIVIGRGLLATLHPRLQRLAAGKPYRPFLITSPNIWRLHAAAVRASFPEGRHPHVLFVPPGEKHKRLATIEQLSEQLAQHGADRDSLLIAFGGGVIGDITGFLAAIYMRGIPFVQIPTTLLAQVDSSVGGKTGVNLAAGKNLVGSFHHPRAVFADIDLLATLPATELRAGLQESIKAGIIRDPALFRYLEQHREAILSGSPAALAHVVAASVRMKAVVVTADERESGQRMLLNFGHTLGHAIEAATGYKRLLHGEAVAWGSIAALHLGLARGLITPEQCARTEQLILAYGPLPRFRATAAQLVALTASDKKSRSGRRAYILPTAIGSAQVVFDVTDEELLTAAEAMLDDMRKVTHPSRMIPLPEHELSTGARPAWSAPESAAHNVQRMFDQIAPRYDLLNHLLSGGIDRLWWWRAARTLRPILARPEARVLDLCCGTGDMALALLRRRPANAAPILAVDFSHSMLLRGARKFAGLPILPVEADALHLPLAAQSVDLVTSAFGFRNLADYAAGLAELYRVLRPGGSLAILECNQPSGLVGALYNLYFRRILPRIGGLLSSGDAYRYLPASVERFPRPPRMIQLLHEAGFTAPTWTSYTFGVAGLYLADKPLPAVAQTL